jgi:hypothetical protein
MADMAMGPVDTERVHTKLFNLGLLLNVLAPAVLIFVGALLKASGVGGSPDTDLTIFFWVLIFVAVSEIPAIYIVKRSFLSGSKSFQRSRGRLTPEQILLQGGMIIFSLALTPTIYGLVYYLLGGSLERFVLFAAITLFCFLVFKPKLEEVSSFVEKRLDSAENAIET